MTRSVSDPDFKYTPSKNIYGDKLTHLPEALQGLAFADQATETHRGFWRKQFLATKANEQLNDSTLHVEVGCNAGHVCLEWAKQNPEQLYIGIDWKFKQIYRVAEKSADAKVKNLLAFRANIERLPLMFAQGEIDFLYMFFPDPWPKKAQMKNRTASKDWLSKMAPLLSGKGYFHLKTDHREYFDFIRQNLAELSDTFEVFEESFDLHADNPRARELKIPEVTLFERLFIRDGLPIHSLKARAKSISPAQA